MIKSFTYFHIIFNIIVVLIINISNVLMVLDIGFCVWLDLQLYENLSVHWVVYMYAHYMYILPWCIINVHMHFPIYCACLITNPRNGADRQLSPPLSIAVCVTFKACTCTSRACWRSKPAPHRRRLHLLKCGI